MFEPANVSTFTLLALCGLKLALGWQKNKHVKNHSCQIHKLFDAEMMSRSIQEFWYTFCPDQFTGTSSKQLMKNLLNFWCAQFVCLQATSYPNK